MLRKEALAAILSRSPILTNNFKSDVSEFGVNVFNQEQMKSYLSKSSCDKVIDAIKYGNKISISVANEVANAMKNWAIARGATHYTHWFQPLTGATAEKHDAFLEPDGQGGAIAYFDGKRLVQQEPDASSFPSGGLRNTFEARGYTAWDPSSPAFVLDNTLCIPTIFVSYTGEALDYKAPLLNALTAVDKAATEVAQYFDKTVEKVQASLGWEQEFFLIDEYLYHARPDLQLTGRTLFGLGSAKNQQLNDHYFGAINERVIHFFKEFEYEAIRLGIPVKTRHNEVAPMQFECAPVFEECNLAVDHNQLAMELLKRIAKRHHFVVLFHEKPFAGINGSGKHNNWSLHTDTGVNLFKPGKNPKQNLQFLSFFVCAIKAVSDYPDLLRAAVLTAGNDQRLGTNEAPPPLPSVFIGTELTAMLNEIEQKVKGGKMTPEEKTAIKLNIGKIPQILVDNTDRNRTSPFAFTGNKFEVRSAGASVNCAAVMTVLNTMMAATLQEFKKEVDQRIDKGQER
jgi:glutamine synthetase